MFYTVLFTYIHRLIPFSFLYVLCYTLYVYIDFNHFDLYFYLHYLYLYVSVFIRSLFDYLFSNLFLKCIFIYYRHSVLKIAEIILTFTLIFRLHKFLYKHNFVTFRFRIQILIDIFIHLYVNKLWKDSS